MFNRTRRLSALVGCLFCLSLLAGARGEAVQLSVKLAPGTKKTIKMLTDQKISQTVMGQSMNVDQSIGMTYSLTATGVLPDGSTTVDVTYEAVSFKTNAPGQNVDYDSTRPQQGEIPMLAKTFAAMVGAKMTMTMAPDGKVTKVDGAEAFLQKIVDGMGLPEGPMRQQVMDQMKQQFSGEQLAASMQQLISTYPAKPLNVGDTWTQSQNLGAGSMPFTADTTYTVKGIDGSSVVLGLDSKLNAAPLFGADPSQPQMTLTGTQKGDMIVDRASGMPRKANLRQDISGKMSAQGMEIPMTITSNITMEAVGN
jgi:hypothetical protein